MIDLHCHILPGIDDGPADRESAVAMAHAYEADGIETVVATPHLRADYPLVVPEEIEPHCIAIESAAAADGAQLEIVAGGEVDLAWALDASDDALRTVSFDGRGRDLLIETPPNPLGPGVEEALFSLSVRGYRLTLAHPELSVAYQRAPERLLALAERGVLLQVTASALLRLPKRSASAALAHELVRGGFCAAIASDAHSPGPWRPPELGRAAVAAARIASPARAEWLVNDAPEAIISGRPLPPLPAAAPTPRGRAWLRRRAGV